MNMCYILMIYLIVIFIIKYMKEWTGNEIEDFRKTQKLTRKLLGDLVGVTVSTIYQWERGLKTASKTAKLLLSRIEHDFEQNEKKRKEKTDG